MKATRLGIYLMIGTIFSLAITIPLDAGYLSGILFGIAMLFTWGAAIWMTIVRIISSKGKNR